MKLAKALSGRRGFLAWLTVVTLMLCGGAYLHWSGARPPVVPDGRLYPEPNGYDTCRALTADLLQVPDEASIGRAGREAEARTLVSKHAGKLDALHEAVRLEYMNPAGIDLHDDLVFLKGYRTAARLLAFRAHTSLAAGKRDAALADTLTAVELGTRVGRGGGLLPHLVGLACCAIGGRELEACTPRLSRDEAAAARRRLQPLALRFYAAPDVLPEERRIWYGTLRKLFHDGFDPHQAHRSASDLPLDLPPPSVLRLYPKPWVYAETETYYRAVEAELRKPFRERRTVRAPKEPLSNSWLSGDVLEKWSQAVTVAEARLRLQTVLLALREYQVRTDHLPASLDSLRPALDAKTLQDPFAKGAFVYRRSGAESLLYSLGPNGVDDGGKPLTPNEVRDGVAGDLVAGHLFTAREKTGEPLDAVPTHQK